MWKTTLSLFFIVTIISCGSSVNPQLKSKIDPNFSNISSRNYSSGVKFMRPTPYKVGQWVMYGITENDGKRSVTKTSIVGREGKALIIEFYSLTEKEESIAQICVTGLDSAASSGKLDDVEYLWIKVKDSNGTINKMDGPMLMMMKAMYKGSLSSFKHDKIVFKNGGTVSVPAGVFSRTNRIESESSFMGSTHKSTSWHHSAVPISGTVKSVSDNGKYQMVLLKFGLRGAASMM